MEVNTSLDPIKANSGTWANMLILDALNLSSDSVCSMYPCLVMSFLRMISITPAYNMAQAAKIIPIPVKKEDGRNN